MEYARLMHMVNRFHELINVELNSILWEIMRPVLYCLIHIHLHELKHKRQSTCSFIIKDFKKVDDVRMRRQPLQSLDLPQLLHLLQRVEMVLHAFYRHILTRLYRLGFENF